LTGYCLHDTVNYTTENAVAAIDGNICRCTGYKSLQKAAANINEIITHKDKTDNINWLVENKFLPNYFTTIKQRLQKLNEVHSSQNTMQQKSIFVGGGTDLFVQKPEDMVEHEINHVADDNELKALSFDKGICTLGAATTVETLKQSATFQSYFPRIHEFLKLVSSTPIRNMATIAGNFVNASPIGDMTVFFLALDANISLQNQQGTTRTISLKSFYKGYKMMDKKEGEYIKSISFKLPTDNSLFNFEKVSKRTHLDIASVNTAYK
jgi:xanthine dehydrogenase small subunit